MPCNTLVSAEFAYTLTTNGPTVRIWPRPIIDENMQQWPGTFPPGPSTAMLG